jgi:hypothetical protein
MSSNVLKMQFYICTEVDAAGWCSRNACDLYSEHARLESRPEHLLYLLRLILAFFSPSTKMARKESPLENGRFLPNISHLIIH